MGDGMGEIRTLFSAEVAARIRSHNSEGRAPAALAGTEDDGAGTEDLLRTGAPPARRHGGGQARQRERRVGWKGMSGQGGCTRGCGFHRPRALAVLMPGSFALVPCGNAHEDMI